jgi:hypothetical protein
MDLFLFHHKNRLRSLPLTFVLRVVIQTERVEANHATVSDQVVFLTDLKFAFILHVPCLASSANRVVIVRWCIQLFGPRCRRPVPGPNNSSLR